MNESINHWHYQRQHHHRWSYVLHYPLMMEVDEPAWEIGTDNRRRFCGVSILRRVIGGRNATSHVGMARSSQESGCAAFVELSLQLSAC
jgi:hypothetical protein